MDKILWNKIDLWFEAHREEMIGEIKRIVRFPSVSVPWNESMGVDRAEYGPFGMANREVLLEMLKMGEEHGFYTRNYEDYVGSICTSENPVMENTFGFWNHLDVVPVGQGWSQDPFEAVEKEGFLIGRGAGDNKGPAIGILYMMQCLRELGIQLKHDLCLYVGTDEERGMEDLEYFTAHYPTPSLSMVADCGFPVCYGEKGIIEGQFVTSMPWSDAFVSVTGGNASNMIPDRAYAVLKDREGLFAALTEKFRDCLGEKLLLEKKDDTLVITSIGTSRHSAFPMGSINAFHVLAEAMLTLDFLTEGDRDLFSLLEIASRGYYGEEEEAAFEDEISGKTTVTATVLTMEEGCMSLNLNIRYSITADSAKLIRKLEAFAKKHHAAWRLERDSKPGYYPKENKPVAFLTDLYNEWQGLSTEAFVMGGGTYARKLPNAFAFGIGGMPETDDDRERKAKLFRAGSGGAHEPDEGLNLRTYFEAFKFYTYAIIALDREV